MKFTTGVAATAVVGALVAWMLSWAVAWLAHTVRGTAEVAPPGLWFPITAAVVVTAAGAGLLVVLAAAAPSPVMFFVCIATLVGLAVTFAPITSSGSSWDHGIGAAVVNGSLVTITAVLLITIARSTVNLSENATSDQPRG